MQASELLAAKDTEAMLGALHDAGVSAAIGALGAILARAQARRLLPELRQERQRQADALPDLHDAIAAADVAMAARAALVLEAEHALLEFPDGIMTGLTREQYEAREHWRVQLQRRRNVQQAGSSEANTARRRYAMAQDAVALLDGKIDALEHLALDAETLGELGEALA